jgi:SNF2 family DNA or RNA helicase
MTESDRHLLWERRLVASSATLIVVPDALLEHWYQQIDQHLNLAPFADKKEQQQNSSMFRGMVYVDGVRDLADVIEGGTVFRNISLVKPIVKAWELSKYLVVITTFSRCQAECQREVTAWRMEGLQSSTKRGTKRRRVDPVSSEDVMGSPLLQMRWLRVVVDEGHELGTHEADTAVTRLIYEIAAKRRWVLSGTLTTGIEDDTRYSDRVLDQMQRLLCFLRHPAYGHVASSSTLHILPGQKDKATLKERARNDWVRNAKQPSLAKQLRSGKM